MSAHRTWITAHAGAENTQDNSLESLEKMVNFGADSIEADIRRQDGVLVLSHNAIEPDKKYVTLDECFCLIKGHEGLWVNADLKEPGMVREVEAVARRCGMSGRYLLTGDVSEAEISWAKAEGVTVWGNDERPEGSAEDPVAWVCRRGPDVANLYYGAVTDEMLERDAQKLSIWTVEDEELMKKYIRAGVKNITTRSPLRALELRGEWTTKL